MTRHPLVAAVCLLALAAVIGSQTTATGHPVAGAPKCRIFPKNNPWNQRVDKLPVLGNSRAIVDSMGADRGLHPDFGSGNYDGAPIGIPYTTVKHSQHKVHVSFDYSDESDKGPYPIPK